MGAPEPPDGGDGGPPDGACRPAARPPPPLNANPDATAPAVIAPLITVIRVPPMSPRTMRLATKGMRATMIDSKTLATLITIIWLEPTNAFRNEPLNCIGLVICSAVISACRIAYSRPQHWKIIMLDRKSTRLN